MQRLAGLARLQGISSGHPREPAVSFFLFLFFFGHTAEPRSTALSGWKRAACISHFFQGAGWLAVCSRYFAEFINNLARLHPSEGRLERAFSAASCLFRQESESGQQPHLIPIQCARAMASCAVHRRPLCLPTLPPLVPCRCAITLVIQRRRRLSATPFFLFTLSSLEADSGRIVPSVFAFFWHASFLRRSISATTPHFSHQSDRPTLHTAANAPPSSRCIRSDPFSFSCILAAHLPTSPRALDALSYRSDPLVSGVDLLAPQREHPLGPPRVFTLPSYRHASLLRCFFCSGPPSTQIASCTRARLASWLPSSPPSTIPRQCIRLQVTPATTLRSWPVHPASPRILLASRLL